MTELLLRLLEADSGSEDDCNVGFKWVWFRWELNEMSEAFGPWSPTTAGSWA